MTSFQQRLLAEPVAHVCSAPGGGPAPAWLLSRGPTGTAEAAAEMNASTAMEEGKKGSAARSSTNGGAEGDFSATSANPASNEAPIKVSSVASNRMIREGLTTCCGPILHGHLSDLFGGQAGGTGEATAWDIAVREWPTILLLPMQALVLVVSIFVLPCQGAYQVADWRFPKFLLTLGVPLAGLGLSFYIMGELAMKRRVNDMKTKKQVDKVFQDSRDSKATLALSMMMCITAYFVSVLCESKVPGCIAHCVQALDMLQKSKMVMNLKAERLLVSKLEKLKAEEEAKKLALEEQLEAAKRDSTKSEADRDAIQKKLNDSKERLKILEGDRKNAGQAQDAPETARRRVELYEKRLQSNAEDERLMAVDQAAKAVRLREDESLRKDEAVRQSNQAREEVERLRKEAAEAVRLREEWRLRKDEAVRLSNQAKEEVERLRKELDRAKKMLQARAGAANAERQFPGHQRDDDCPDLPWQLLGR